MTEGTPGSISGWTPERVVDAAEEWVWVPPGAREVRTDEYHLVAYPETFNVPTSVSWCRSDRPAQELVDEAAGHARRWYRDEVSFWVGQRTRPADLGEVVLSRGGDLAESVEVMALPLERLDALLGELPEGVTVRQVVDAPTRRDANHVASVVWGHAGGDERTEDEEPVPDELRVVGYVDGQPACSAGCTVVGEVARLWGGATVPELRGRGAYRAVLAERLRLAREQGATLGLVKAVVDTSAPILRRCGFSDHGLRHRYRLPLT